MKAPFFDRMENLFWQIGKYKALPTSLWPPSPSWLQSSCSLPQKRINKIEYNRLYPFTGFCQWFFCYQQLSCIYSIIHSLKVCRLYSDFCSSLGTHAHLDMQHQVCQHGCMKWDLKLYICKHLGTQITVYMFGDKYMTIKNLYLHILLWAR